MRGRFICTECLTQQDKGGDCPQCPGEPLMDLANESVRMMLVEEDERAARSRHYAIVIGFAVVGFVLCLPALGVVGTLGWTPELALLPLVSAAGLGELVYRQFPAKRVVPLDP